MSFPTHARMLKLRSRPLSKGFIECISKNPISFCHLFRDRANALLREVNSHPVYFRNLLWLASQLRIHAGNSNPAVECVAGALDYFLHAELNGPDFVADLRWLCFCAIQAMVAEFGPHIRRHYLSKNEREQVEDEWLACVPAPSTKMDLTSLMDGAEAYARRLDMVNNEIHLPDVSSKIRLLARHCRGTNEASIWARAALVYLLKEKDVIPDSWGYLGLVDDISVIEQTCEMIHGCAIWEPLLHHFQNRWPYLREVTFFENESPEKLSSFVKIACGVALDNLVKSEKRFCLVVPERGPLCLLTALFSWLSLQGGEAPPNQDPPDFQLGDDIELWSASRVIKARFAGWENNLLSGFFISLSPSRRPGPHSGPKVMLTNPYYRFVRKAKSSHKSLSLHSEFQEWRESVQPDLVSALLGHRGQVFRNPRILILMRRNRLQSLLEHCKPMGQSLEQILGLLYVTGRKTIQCWGRGRHGRPQLVACSKPLIAKEWLEGRLESFTSIPRMMLIDEPALALNAIRSSCKSQPSTMVLAEPAEREALVELEGQGFRNWYLSGEDIIPHPQPTGHFPPLTSYLFSYMWRQHLVPQVLHVTEEIQQPLLAELHQNLEKIRKSYHEDAVVMPPAVHVFTFLREIEQQITRPSNKERSKLAEKIETLMNWVNMSLPYAPLLEETRAHLEALMGSLSAWPCNRVATLTEILSRQSFTGQRVGILCHPRFFAKLEKVTNGIPVDPIFLRAKDLESAPPLETLIVVHWFRRDVLRRLQHGGYAKVYLYLFFAHEHRWLNNLRQADQRFRQKLKTDLRRQWSTWQESYPLPEVNDSLQSQGLKEEETGLAKNSVKDTAADTEKPCDFDSWLETHSRERVKNLSKSRGSKTGSAHLVFFDSPLYFFFAAPKSRIVCVNTIHDEQDSDPASRILRPFHQAVVGDLLAFPLEDRENVLDALADLHMDNPHQLRLTAALWREAIREHYLELGGNLESFRHYLAQKGLKRSVQTLRLWIGAGHMIAPQYQEDLELIVNITGNHNLKSQFVPMVKAIKAIYHARSKAGRQFLRSAATVDIEDEQEIVTMKTMGCDFHFRLLRIAKIEPPRRVPHEWIGRLHDCWPEPKSTINPSKGA